MHIPTLLCALSLLAPASQEALPRRGMLGLPLAQVSAEARAAAKLGDGFGLLIAQAPTNGNAGDLKQGDVLTEINGKPFASGPEFTELVRPSLVQPSLEVTYVRAGEKRRTTVKILPKPNDEGPNHTTIYDQVVSNGKRIRVIVTKPKNHAGKRPTMFWIQGISTGSVDQPLAADNYITNAIRPFSDDGWATVRVEKEGVGDSEGGPALLVNFDSEVDIYRQALKKLSSYDFVDMDRIYVFGHSMGGCHAPIVCSEVPVKGIAVYGTVSMSWLEWQVRAPRIQSPLSGIAESDVDDQIRKDTAFYHYLYTEKKSVEWIVENHPELAATAREQSPDGIMLGVRSIEYMRQCNDQNYARHWEHVKGAKVLAMFGENDYISLREDQTQIPAIMNRVRPGSAEFRQLPGIDHLFRTTDSMKDSADQIGGVKPAKAFNSVLVDTLKAWIAEVEKG
jgi:pimeloyl-ACP methyl ester carboxylesterase